MQQNTFALQIYAKEKKIKEKKYIFDIYIYNRAKQVLHNIQVKKFR